MSGSVWRSTWLHGGLLILALVGAWLSYRRPFDDDPSTASRGLIAIQAAEGDVECVVYERPDRTLAIEAREDARGRWFAGREGPDTVFVGGRRVAQAWQALEPLRAVRILEDVDGDKLEELELAGDGASGEFLVLTVRGREVRYRLGGRPFGGSDRYARRQSDEGGGSDRNAGRQSDEGGGSDRNAGRQPDEGYPDQAGRVLVLPSEVTAGLGGGAEMLMERRLLEAARPEVEAMTLSRAAAPSGKLLRIVQRPGADPGSSRWTVGESDESDADIAAWVDKFFRLSAVSYRSGEPALDWRAEASITVESREQGATALEIWSVPADEGRLWLARSPFTRFVVALSPSLAEEVCADLDGLLR